MMAKSRFPFVRPQGPAAFVWACVALSSATFGLSACGLLDKDDVARALEQNKSDDEPSGRESPCAAFDCGPDQRCVVLKTNPPTAACEPVEEGLENPCAATLCRQGQVCVVSKSLPPQATCVDQEPVASCYSSSDCQAGQTCSVERGDCQPPPGCGEGRICPAVCTGVCETSAPPGACRTDADCRLESNYCGGCQCDALGPNQKGSVCGNPVACFADPCQGLQAVCSGGTCQAAKPSEGACTTEVQGGETSCKSTAVWKSYAAQACEKQGKRLADISYGTPCGGDNHRRVKYQCCS